MIELPLLPQAAFLVGSVPLVWQDVRHLAVSSTWLAATLGGWAVVAWWTSGSWSAAAALSAGVFTAGTVLLLLLPDSLGEADVIYLGALAWLLPFWGFLWAVAMACVLAAGGYLALARGGHRDIRQVPLPFLPFLALGGWGALGSLS